MKDGKATATRGDATIPVQIFHWWPGRQFLGVNPIPAYVIKDAKRRRSRYVTLAMADVPEGPIGGLAVCCQKDAPDRAMGRRIALGRLAANLEPMGWTIE